MTKTNIDNPRRNEGIMSKLRAKVRSEGRKVDAMNIEREYADRIAAAEAMSCLSSVVILPSNSEELLNVSQQENEKLIAEAVAKSKTKTATSTKSRRGKTKSVNKKHEGGNSSTNQNTEKITIDNSGTVAKSKGKSKNATKRTTTTESSTINHMVSVPQNPTLLPNGNPVTISNLANLIGLSRLQDFLREKKFAEQLQQENTSSSNKANSNIISSQVLKLPLLISNSSDLGKSEVRELTSPSSVKSTDSVELTASSVDSVLNTTLKQPESLTSSLPLKKRKVLGLEEKSETTSSSSSKNVSVSSTTGDVIDLTMEENRLQNKNKETSSSQEAVSKVPSSLINVDPQTSLMLLTEVHLALQQDDDGDLPLHIAVVHENIVMVQKFVHLMSISGKTVDRYNKAQQTPLHLAVELKFLEAIQVLLLAGANPNLVNKRGENSIHLSVKYNIIAALQIMIEKSQHPLDLNTRNFDGLSPLHTAVCKNNIDIVKLLLSAGADINILDGKCGKTPLFYAVEFNNTNLVDIFQSQGANIDLPNYAGITAAMAAQARGYQETQAILLKGMDAKAYFEGKERDRSITPGKKVPIPRIPSKSHLIVSESQSKPSGHSTDSNDSSSWLDQSNSMMQNKFANEPMEFINTTAEEIEVTNPVHMDSPFPSVKLPVKRTSPLLNTNNTNETVSNVLLSKTHGPTGGRGGNSVTTSEGHMTSVNASTATLLAKRLLARQLSALQKPLDLSSKTDYTTLGVNSDR